MLFDIKILSNIDINRPKNANEQLMKRLRTTVWCILNLISSEEHEVIEASSNSTEHSILPLHSKTALSAWLLT